VWKYHKLTVISYRWGNCHRPRAGKATFSIARRRKRAGNFAFLSWQARRATPQQPDKSNDLIQPDFNFPLQAYGVRMADKEV